MSTIEETRRANLAKLRDEAGGVRRLADAVGVSEAQMSQWLNGSADSKTGKPRGMRQESARRIETAMKRAEGWLDVPHDDESAPAQRVDHVVSYPKIETPPITPWEVVVSLEKMPEVPADLMVEVPDDALKAAGLGKGQVIWFRAAQKAEPANVVLIEAEGRRYIRRYTEDGRAAPMDSAYKTFTDFRVVAVMFMRPGSSV